MALRSFLRSYDWLLLGSVVVMAAIGLALLYSVATGREGGDLSAFWKQLVIAGIGLVALFSVSLVNFHTWNSMTRFVYGGTIALLGIVLVFGQTINATRGWLVIGGFTFQPVELAKVSAILILAAYFARRSRELDRLQYLLQSLALVGSIIALVLLQPDFGSAALIFAVWACMVLTIGVRREYFLAFGALAIIGFAVGWLFLFKPYQKERLVTFLFPSDKTAAQSYNVRQALIAVGSGQMAGRGLGEGSQSQLRFLPEASTDFIFATLGEELGFAGISVLFLLIGIIYYRLFRLLSITSDGFASFVVLGTILLLSVEIFVNAGMNMGLVPVVGVPFPLLSSGGSALLAHLILFGVIENIARFEGSRGYRLSTSSAV